MSQLLLDIPNQTTESQFHDPAGYKGLYAFHKYWGKKPAETISFLIDKLSDPNDLILDPFMGSGAIAREAIARGRRFIGGDINPISIDLASTILRLPSSASIRKAVKLIESEVARDISETYLLEDGSYASHYLWDEDELIEVWSKKKGSRTRIELEPTEHDHRLISAFADYTPHNLRPLTTFKNSRINSPGKLEWGDLFTGRALHNLELIRSSILAISDDTVRTALLTALTAASGQMSRMVFAIEKRGKSSGQISSKRKEVGSWVIGFWRPKLHFEVNSWNCFINKAKALIRGLESPGIMPIEISDNPTSLLDLSKRCCICQLDALSLLEKLPKGSVDVIITDPPHGDRIPYLELSEIWNAILGKEAPFEREIVVTNAAERRQTSLAYGDKLKQLFRHAGEVISEQGALVIMFNSRSKSEWCDLIVATTAGGLEYAGCFPMAYSAGSVVQDNRDGAMKSDYVLVFQPASSVVNKRIQRLTTLSSWSNSIPLMSE
jgi:16S rRNA G966 N2-methylase RsmD